MTAVADLPFAVLDYDDGVSALDSGYGRPMLDAIHLVVEGDRAAVIDTGANDAVPRVLALLAARGVAPEQVDWVMLTHVHLDHAGGAGLLLRRLPNARATVHPRGARHLIDPSRLLAGTVEVYGEQRTRTMYGDVVPIPAARIVETPDGASIALGERRFTFLDTPGHARHHVCIVDGRTGHVFAGDTFGLSYRELDRDGRTFVFPSTTPVQFDPPALHRSIDRLLALAPAAIHVTHFAQARDPARLGADLHRLVDAHAALATRWRGAGADRHARLVDGLWRLLDEEAARQGWAVQGDALRPLFDNDIDLNAAGLVAWLDAGR